MVKKDQEIVRILVNPSQEEVNSLQDLGYSVLPFDKEEARKAFVKDQAITQFFTKKAENIPQFEVALEEDKKEESLSQEAKFSLLSEEIEHLHKHVLKNKLHARKALKKKVCELKDVVSKLELDVAFMSDDTYNKLEQLLLDVEALKQRPIETKTVVKEVQAPVIMQQLDHTDQLHALTLELVSLQENYETLQKRALIGFILIGLLAIVF